MSCRDDVLIDLKHRIFYLSGDISNETVGKVCFNILYLLQEDDEKEASEVGFTRKPIHIYVHSFGGEAYDMWALIDVIFKFKNASVYLLYRICYECWISNILSWA